MTGIAAISLILSVVAILISLKAERDTRRQTVLMEQQESRRQSEEKSTAEWAKKFDEAVGAVRAIGPKMLPPRLPERDYSGQAYPTVFSDVALRQRIETYLIDADPGRNRFSARQASSDLLRMPLVQQTIQEVLTRVKRLKETEPDTAKLLGL
jgi:hypothetical protein